MSLEEKEPTGMYKTLSKTEETRNHLSVGAGFWPTTVVLILTGTQSASKQEPVRGVAFDEFLGELKQLNGTGETYLGLLKFSNINRYPP